MLYLYSLKEPASEKEWDGTVDGQCRYVFEILNEIAHKLYSKGSGEDFYFWVWSEREPTPVKYHAYCEYVLQTNVTRLGTVQEGAKGEEP